MKTKLTVIFAFLVLSFTAARAYALSPQSAFPKDEKIALSLIEDLMDAISFDFSTEEAPAANNTASKQTVKKHKNPYRNIFYYYGLLYGSTSPIGSSYRSVYNNFLARSAYGVKVNKVVKTQKSREVKRFDLFFPEGMRPKTINTVSTPITQKKDQYIPGEAIVVLDAMQKELETVFINSDTEKMSAKLNVLKEALKLINQSIAQTARQSQAIRAYERNSRPANSSAKQPVFLIRSFIQTMITKMEDKINLPFDQNIQDAFLASA